MAPDSSFSLFPSVLPHPFSPVVAPAALPFALALPGDGHCGHKVLYIQLRLREAKLEPEVTQHKQQSWSSNPRSLLQSLGTSRKKADKELMKEQSSFLSQVQRNGLGTLLNGPPIPLATLFTRCPQCKASQGPIHLIYTHPVKTAWCYYSPTLQVRRLSP